MFICKRTLKIYGKTRNKRKIIEKNKNNNLN